MIRSKLARMRGQPAKDPGADLISEVWYNVITKEALIHYKNFSQERLTTEAVWFDDSQVVQYNINGRPNSIYVTFNEGMILEKNSGRLHVIEKSSHLEF